MKCCICGPVRDCEKYLAKVFENIEKIGNLFDDYKIVIYYDKSIDNTLGELKKYQTKNPKLSFYVNNSPISKYRTHRIARARNYCLNYIKQNKDIYDFFIMMDFDDPNCKICNPEILQKYLRRDDWDGLSFNTSPKYYDIWGLSIYPYCFSYNHFEDSVQNYSKIQDYVMSRLAKVSREGLLPCISSFNGFSIYRTNKFMDTYYDGRVRTDLIPQTYLKAHSKVANSPLIYKDYGNVNGFYEDCEHRAFHVQAITNSGARIMISPEIIFY